VVVVGHARNLDGNDEKYGFGEVVVVGNPQVQEDYCLGELVAVAQKVLQRPLGVNK
jgi:hypothetical protein